MQLGGAEVGSLCVGAAPYCTKPAAAARHAKKRRAVFFFFCVGVFEGVAKKKREP